MRYLLSLMIVFASLNAFAVRYGRDERIFTCTSDAKATYIGANQKFQVHVVDKEEIKLTRMADGKFAHGKMSSWVYSFESSTQAGALLPGFSGYFSRHEDEFSVVVRASSNSYKSDNLENCLLERVISAYDPLTPTEQKMEAIMEIANVGNGGYDFFRFDVNTIDFNAEKSEMKAQGDRWERCTWEYQEGFENIVKLVAEHTWDEATAEKIAALEKNPGVITAFAYVSDDDISCSNTIINVYTQDGIKLELFYSLGD